MLTKNRTNSDMSTTSRRKECCYQEQSSPGIVLKYMDIFLKISNHLMLLCPGTETPKKVSGI